MRIANIQLRLLRKAIIEGARLDDREKIIPPLVSLASFFIILSRMHLKYVMCVRLVIECEGLIQAGISKLAI